MTTNGRAARIVVAQKESASGISFSSNPTVDLFH